MRSAQYLHSNYCAQMFDIFQFVKAAAAANFQPDVSNVAHTREWWCGQSSLVDLGRAKCNQALEASVAFAEAIRAPN